MARIRMKMEQAVSLNAGDASLAELKAAYTALRDTMQKRVARLAEGTETQQRFARPFLDGGVKELKTLGEIRRLPYQKDLDVKGQLRDMERRVEELQQLIKSPRLSIKGWKEIETRTVESLRSSGYENINKKNLAQFGSYMESLRSMFGDKFFPSAEAAEAYDKAISQEGRSLDPGELMDLISEFAGGGYGDGVDLFAW